MLIAAIYDDSVRVLEADRSSLPTKIRHTLLNTDANEVVILWKGTYYTCTPLGDGYTRKKLEPGDERELFIPGRR